MLKHLKNILLLPFNVIVAIPAILWYFFPLSTLFFNEFYAVVAAFVGLACAIIGLVLLVSTIRLFCLHAHGTIAPWDPSQKLVVLGPYRHVRNPMISGVIFTLFGLAMLINNLALLVWAVVFLIANLIYIRSKEEPDLEKRFGQVYLTYKNHVPRWIPRFTAWRSPSDRE